MNFESLMTLILGTIGRGSGHFNQVHRVHFRKLTGGYLLNDAII